MTSVRYHLPFLFLFIFWQYYYSVLSCIDINQCVVLLPCSVVAFCDNWCGCYAGVKIRRRCQSFWLVLSYKTIKKNSPTFLCPVYNNFCLTSASHLGRCVILLWGYKKGNALPFYLQFYVRLSSLKKNSEWPNPGWKSTQSLNPCSSYSFCLQIFPLNIFFPLVSSQSRPVLLAG